MNNIYVEYVSGFSVRPNLNSSLPPSHPATGDDHNHLHDTGDWHWQLLEDGSLPMQPSDIPQKPRYRPATAVEFTSDYAMLNAKRRRLHHDRTRDEEDDEFSKPKIVASRFYIQPKMTRTRQPEDHEPDQLTAHYIRTHGTKKPRVSNELD